MGETTETAPTLERGSIVLKAIYYGVHEYFLE